MTITDQIICDICHQAHNRFVNWYNFILNNDSAIHLNEHLYTSFILDEFKKINAINNSNIFGTFETNREIIELGSNCDLFSDRYDEEKSNNRFDLVIWDESLPLGAIEAKGSQNFEGIRNDVERLWHLVRRIENDAFFGISATTLWGLNNPENIFNEKINRLRTHEGYDFLSAYFDGPLLKSTKRTRKNTGCGIIILRLVNIGNKYRIKS